MSAGRDDEARTRKRKKQVRKAIASWKENRAEVKARKRARKARYKRAFKPAS